MIRSAKEFIELRTSHVPTDYQRAATDSASLEVWYEIINHFPEMKVWVAHNKTVPSEILAILATDADPDVRFVVAQKNKLPRDVMERLARDDQEEVRRRIAYNKMVPLHVLLDLSKDESESVREAASRRLRKPTRES
ncbi:MAG: hypothetical protein ACLGG7_13615 [Bacteriovoracia bacterium]